MNRTLLIFTVVLGVLALGLMSYLLLYKRDVVMPVVIESGSKTGTLYSSPEQSLSFTYAPTLYLQENKNPAGRAVLSLVLVEDTEENREVLDGRTTVPREGPPTITIEVYPNPDKLPAEDWVRADSTWTVRTSDAAPIGRGQITGVTYSWSGLYEGRSVIVTKDTRAYVFSVTWLTEEDRLLEEFDRILSSVTL